MSDETTHLIAGDAAVDALTEGRRGRRFLRRAKKASPTLTHCENCEAPLSGAYCAKCGQHAIDYRRSLNRVLIDAADSFLNWDTKFLHSVGVLMTRPWRLTNDFNAGRRARYVHPLRLYLLASVAFFLMVQLINIAPSKAIHLDPQDRLELGATLGDLAGPESPFPPELRGKIEAARTKLTTGDGTLSSEERAQLKTALEEMPGDTREAAAPAEAGRFRQERKRLKAALAKIPKPTPTPGESGAAAPGIPTAAADGTENSNSAAPSWIEKRIRTKIGKDGTGAKLFLETLRSHIPTMMLCCIPLFAFVLKILYLRRRRFYVEHLVYALHIHTFVYVGVVLITLLAMGADRSLPGLSSPMVVLLSCVLAAQVFLSIRRVYRQGWFTTTLKFLLGGVAYLFILACAVATTALLTLLLPD